MKKVISLVAIIATLFNQQLFAQDAKVSTSLSPLLTSYYDIGKALTNADTQDAAARAGEFLKTLKAVDMKALPKTDMDGFMAIQDKLAFDARHIADSKDIAHQREHFASFSVNFFKLAKAVKLTDQPLYYAYCPMKKSYWLSPDAAIKNPYYGKQMLTCGKVTETLNK